MTDERPTDPAPAPSSESQQMRAVKPYDEVFASMSQRQADMSECITELRTDVGALLRAVERLAKAIDALTHALTEHTREENDRFERIERRIANGAEAP